MKRFLVILICLATCFSVFAQEIDSDYVFRASQAGDQYAKVTLSLNIPNKPEQLKTGGAGTLGYHYFITDNFNIGGDIGFNYLTTVGKNVYYSIPFLLKVGYQFNSGSFEVPVYLGLGGTIQNYLDKSYFGLTIKPEVGVYYRVSSDWSFGVLGGVYIMPQTFKDKKYNYVGVITDISVGVRYHF